jgi:hypothetical protein
MAVYLFVLGLFGMGLGFDRFCVTYVVSTSKDITGIALNELLSRLYVDTELCFDSLYWDLGSEREKCI